MSTAIHNQRTEQQARAEFLARRRRFIGGSDIQHLFGIEPYGCRLRLWNDKRGIAPDYPEHESEVQRRGTLLEPLVVAEYERKTGRHAGVMSSITDPDRPHLGVNIDRCVWARSEEVARDPWKSGPGVFEGKSHNREQFWAIKRDGIQPGHILQVQHGIGVTGWGWGSFAVLHPDSWELIYFDVQRNERLIADIRAMGDLFWPLVENGPAPARLDADARACRGCPYRNSCQGAWDTASENGDQPQGPAGNDPALVPAIEAYLGAKRLEQEAKELAGDQHARLAEMLGARKLVQSGPYKVHYRSHKRNNWKSEHLAQAYDRISGGMDVLIALGKKAGVEPEGGWEQYELRQPSSDFRSEIAVRPLRIYGGSNGDNE